MLLVQAADAGNHLELVLKVMGAALPVVAGVHAVFQGRRKRPQMPARADISVVKLSHDDMRAPEIVDHRPPDPDWLDDLAGNLLVQFIGGGVYLASGVMLSVPPFTVLGVGVLIYAAWRLVWRVVLSTFEEVSSDRVDIATVVTGDANAIFDRCIDAVLHLDGRVNEIDRDSRVVDATGKSGAWVGLRVVTETSDEGGRERERSSASPSRYRVRMTIETSKPDPWTVNRNVSLGRKLIEQITGIRWSRPGARKAEA